MEVISRAALYLDTIKTVRWINTRIIKQFKHFAFKFACYLCPNPIFLLSAFTKKKIQRHFFILYPNQN